MINAPLRISTFIAIVFLLFTTTNDEKLTFYIGVLFGLSSYAFALWIDSKWK